MNRKQVAFIVSMAALIVSPTLALVAMQMPLWISPRHAVLNSIPYADLDLSWDVPGPENWTIEADVHGI